MNTPTRPARQPGMDASALSEPWRTRPALASLLIVLAAHVGAIWALQRGMIRSEPHAPVSEPVMVELLATSSPSTPASPSPEPPKQVAAVKPEPMPKTVKPAAAAPSKAARSPPPVTPRPAETPTAEPAPLPASNGSPAAAEAENRTTAALSSTENQATATGPIASVTTAAATPAPPPVQLPSADADYLLNPKPAYPTLSLRLGEKGQVVHRVWIGPDGRPTRAELVSSSGFARLDRVAYETVLRWRYVPGRRNGVPQAMSVEIPINWQLPR